MHKDRPHILTRCNWEYASGAFSKINTLPHRFMYIYMDTHKEEYATPCIYIYILL